MKTKQLIYVIEDSDIIREVVSLVFLANHTVKSFRTGEELFSNFSDEIPNLIILDYYLNAHDKNAMNGYDVLKRLSENNIKSKTILLSGMHDESKVKQMKELGVVDFIDKDGDDIFTMIERVSAKYLQ